MSRFTQWLVLVVILVCVLVYFTAPANRPPTDYRELCHYQREQLRDKPRIMWTENEVAKLKRWCDLANVQEGRPR